MNFNKKNWYIDLFNTHKIKQMIYSRSLVFLKGVIQRITLFYHVLAKPKRS